MFSSTESSTYFKVIKIIKTRRNYPDKLFNLTFRKLKDSNHRGLKYSFPPNYWIVRSNEGSPSLQHMQHCGKMVWLQPCGKIVSNFSQLPGCFSDHQQQKSAIHQFGSTRQWCRQNNSGKILGFRVNGYPSQPQQYLNLCNICGSGDEVAGAEPDRGRAAGHDQRGGRRWQRHHWLPRVPHHDGQENEGHRQVSRIKENQRRPIRTDPDHWIPI